MGLLPYIFPIKKQNIGVQRNKSCLSKNFKSIIIFVHAFKDFLFKGESRNGKKLYIVTISATCVHIE